MPHVGNTTISCACRRGFVPTRTVSSGVHCTKSEDSVRVTRRTLPACWRVKPTYLPNASAQKALGCVPCASTSGIGMGSSHRNPSGENATVICGSPQKNILYRLDGSVSRSSLKTPAPFTWRMTMLFCLLPLNSISPSSGFSQWIPSVEEA